MREPLPLCAVIVVGDEAVLFKKYPRRVRRPTLGARNSGRVLFNLEEPLDFPDGLVDTLLLGDVAPANIPRETFDPVNIPAERKQSALSRIACDGSLFWSHL